MNRYKLTHAGIDVNQGIRRFNNDINMYSEVLQRFPSDVNYTGMLNALQGQDCEAAFHYAHALKGLAGNLSLVRLHADLIPLVEELRKRTLEGIAPLVEPVIQDYDAIISALQDDR